MASGKNGKLRREMISDEEQRQCNTESFCFRTAFVVIRFYENICSDSTGDFRSNSLTTLSSLAIKVKREMRNDNSRWSYP